MRMFLLGNLEGRCHPAMTRIPQTIQKKKNNQAKVQEPPHRAAVSRELDVQGTLCQIPLKNWTSYAEFHQTQCINKK